VAQASADEKILEQARAAETVVDCTRVVPDRAKKSGTTNRAADNGADPARLQYGACGSPPIFQSRFFHGFLE
jgi:hypothetical protein